MTALALIGGVALVIIGVPALFIMLDCACARIARALRDASRP
jgi:hypothetical protein